MLPPQLLHALLMHLNPWGSPTATPDVLDLRVDGPAAAECMVAIGNMKGRALCCAVATVAMAL